MEDVMKRVYSWFGAVVVATLLNTAAAGEFTRTTFKDFTLHVYNSGDVMADSSYIVEGKDALITLEEPLFKQADAEFESYLSALHKPVATRIVDYHLGGTDDHAVFMPAGMEQFVKGTLYNGMMQSFKRQFGEAMVDLPTGSVCEVPFDKRINLCGIDFVFMHGASTDFPAASILIGDKVYLTHWAPVLAHANALQYSARAAVAAELNAAQQALASPAVLFAGSHGGIMERKGMQFKVAYLLTVQRLLQLYSDAASFKVALIEAYPGLPGSEGLDALAQALYR